MTKKAVVLFSGGLDSTTNLAIAKDEGFELYALSFDYGQRNRAEIAAGKVIAREAEVKSHKIMQLNLSQFDAHSALVNEDLAVPDYSELNEIPITYVPGRNTIFLSFALGWADILGAAAIFFGANCVDFPGYPDCWPEYIQAYEKMMNLAVKSAVEGNKIALRTPLLHLNKREIINWGQRLGVDYAKTVSCYRPSEAGLACGSCDTCVHRKRGFEQAGLVDVTRYQ